MSTAHPRPLIAVMNSSTDLVKLLQESLAQDGFRVITHVSTIRQGVDDVLTFLRDQHPDVVVYSISLPYRENWDILAAVRRLWRLAGFVVVTTNTGALRRWVSAADAIELIGKPFDLDHIAQAVRHALAVRADGSDGTGPGPERLRCA